MIVDDIPIIRCVVNAIASHLLVPGSRYASLRLDLQDGDEPIDLGPFEVDENGQVVEPGSLVDDWHSDESGQSLDTGGGDDPPIWR